MDERFPSTGRSAGRNTPATPPPEDIPVAPLPPIVGEPETSPFPDDYPVPPVIRPDEPGQTPVGPGMDFPVPPVIRPDEPGQIPVGPGMDFPVPPVIRPETPGQIPVAPGPDFGPVYPDRPGAIIIPGISLPGLIVPGYCTVRFLNAAAGYEPFRITIGNRLVSNSLAYGTMTGYGRVMDGFRTVTVSNPNAPTSVFYRQTIPFSAGELITLAIVRTNTGLDLVRISDIPCRNRNGRACIRAVNLNYGSPALDVLLNDGRMVFNDVRYKEVTTFKQARPQDYGFYIAQTSFVPNPYFQDIETVEETPMAAPGYFLPGFGSVSPLSSFYVDAKRDGVYTIYILGMWNYQRPNVRVKVVEDFQ